MVRDDTPTLITILYRLRLHNTIYAPTAARLLQYYIMNYDI